MGGFPHGGSTSSAQALLIVRMTDSRLGGCGPHGEKERGWPAGVAREQMRKRPRAGLENRKSFLIFKSFLKF
jgi:hypothetical protein